MIFSLLLDVITAAAKQAAKSLPTSQAGTLAINVEILGWGANTLGQQGKAASHNSSPEIALVASAIGLAAGILLVTPVAAGAGVGLIIANAAAQIGVGAIAGWAAEGILSSIANAVTNYKNGDASELVDMYNGTGGDSSGLLPNAIGQAEWIAPAHGLLQKGMRDYSPLVLDLDGDGIETTRMGYGVGASGVYFDLNNDNFAERTGWVTGGDGLLAWDRDSNGLIDNQSELFGNSTTHADGFAALTALDSNADNKITSADTNWADLRVWIDANGDGKTDTGELKTLSFLGITEISLNETQLTNNYNNENRVSASASFVINSQTRTVADVWFRADSSDTRYLGDQPLIEDVFFLPMLKGYGVVKELSVAMSNDSDLLDLVQDFNDTWSLEKFENKANLASEINQILFTWAGVENVNPTSRGNFVDARELGFIEKYLAHNYGDGPNPFGDNPYEAQGNSVNLIYDYLANRIGAQLIGQVGFCDDIFDVSPSYNSAIGQLTGGTLSANAIAGLSAYATSAPNATDYWVNLVSTLISIKDAGEMSPAEISALNSAIQYNIPSSSWAAILSQAMTDLSSNHTYLPSDFSDLISGSSADETFTGQAGDDVYFFKLGSGIDHVYDSAGNDTIQLGEGITLSDLRFERTQGLDYLTIYVGSADQILLDHHFYDQQYNSNYYDEVETLRLADGTTINLLAPLTFTGTTGNDAITGTKGSDTIVGLEGDDGLDGQAGNDTYKFSGAFGNDTISDDAGSDVIEFGSGITLDDLRFENTYNGLKIYNGANSIYIANHFYDLQYNTNYYDEVEIIRFADTSTLDLKGTLTFAGTSGNDAVNGTKGADILVGMAGNDGLYGQSGNDTYKFEGAFGNDTISDDAGSDVIEFGLGISLDDLRFETTYNGLTIYNGTNSIYMANHFYDLNYGSNYYNEVETVKFSDLSTFNLMGAFTFKGTSENDSVNGTAGADSLIGLAGDDSLSGGNGNDILDGGAGADYLYGDSGADTFLFKAATAFNGIDWLQDFSSGQGDKIDLSDLLGAYDPLTDAIADFVEIAQNGWYSILSVDANGGGNSFVQIANIGATGLTDEAALVASGNLIV